MEIACVVVFLCAIVPLTLGCDPSSWVEPTFERKIHYAKIIAFGNVTEILKKDPANLVGETYGASVYIQCTYKGGPMPGWITIGGAGRAAGLCDKMDLTAYKQHIFFLDNKQEGQDYYMQTGEAVKYNRTIINTLIQTCNLEMNYPEDPESGMMLRRKICTEVPKTPKCKQYQEPTGKSNVGPVVKEAKEGGVVGGPTTKDPVDSSGTVIASITLLMTSLVVSLL